MQTSTVRSLTAYYKNIGITVQTPVPCPTWGSYMSTVWGVTESATFVTSSAASIRPHIETGLQLLDDLAVPTSTPAEEGLIGRILSSPEKISRYLFSSPSSEVGATVS